MVLVHLLQRLPGVHQDVSPVAVYASGRPTPSTTRGSHDRRRLLPGRRCCRGVHFPMQPRQGSLAEDRHLQVHRHCTLPCSPCNPSPSWANLERLECFLPCQRRRQHLYGYHDVFASHSSRYQASNAAAAADRPSCDPKPRALVGSTSLSANEVIFSPLCTYM